MIHFKAMNSFVREMEGFDPAFANSNRANMPTTKRTSIGADIRSSLWARSPLASQSTPVTIQSQTANDSSGIIKQGTLYKQRDLFKGWRSRHFVLQENFLHYYIEAGDPVPKNSMDITGCTVQSVKSTKVGDVEYFPFVITHPKESTAYNLAADMKSVADAWIEKISEASKRHLAAPGSIVLSPNSGNMTRLLGNDGEESGAKVQDGGVHRPISNEMLVGIPQKYAEKCNRAVEALISAFDPSKASEWEPMFESNGVVASKKSGAAICVKGESLLPYPIIEIFELICDPNKFKECDADLNFSRVLQRMNDNTSVKYLRYKQVLHS